MQRERRGDPLLARALAAEQKLEACEGLLKKTAGERYAYQTRVTQLEAHQLSEVRTANAAVSDRSGKVGPINSSGRWSEEADVLENMMKRWRNIADWPELMMRVLVRQKTSDGEDLSFLVSEAPAFEKALAAIIDHRDLEIHQHLSNVTYSPEKAELIRLLTARSWNKTEWCNSIWKYDHNGHSKDGRRCRLREMLGPFSKQPAPLIFDPSRMRAWENEKLQTGYAECPLRNKQQEDCRGAEVTDVDWCFHQAIEAAQTSTAGGMATEGSKEDPHLMLLTGDGAGLTADDSGVRIAVVAGSVPVPTVMRAPHMDTCMLLPCPSRCLVAFAY